MECRHVHVFLNPIFASPFEFHTKNIDKHIQADVRNRFIRRIRAESQACASSSPNLSRSSLLRRWLSCCSPRFERLGTACTCEWRPCTRAPLTRRKPSRWRSQSGSSRAPASAASARMCRRFSQSRRGHTRSAQCTPTEHTRWNGRQASSIERTRVVESVRRAGYETGPSGRQVHTQKLP